LTTLKIVNKLRFAWQCWVVLIRTIHWEVEMKMIKKIAAVAVLSLGVTGICAAEEAKESSVNPWRDCGIGAMLFPTTPFGAVSSNIIWDFGITALTSAGVSKDLCEGKTVAAARFVTESYANLEEETAKGEGKHLHAMLNILGCEQGSHGAIISSVRSDFGAALRQDTYATSNQNEKAERYFGMVESAIKAGHSQQCNAV
jgi:hypothetical protein